MGAIPETTIKTIRFDNETLKKIEQMAEESERDFSGQVRFMCKEYIKMRETK